MSKPDKITDHAALAVGYLLSDLQGSPRLKKLIEIFAAEIQSLEDLYHLLIDDRMLDTAEGVQLDAYGKILVWPRGDLTDADYRKMLKVKVVINCGHGLAKTAAYVLSQMVSEAVRYTQRGRAHYSLDWDVGTDTTDAWIDAINSIMDKITASGVSWELIEGNDGTDPVFLFDTEGAGYDEGGLARRIDT